MDAFRHAFEINNLFDLGWKCDKFTWSNKYEDDSFTKERLDKVVVNALWTKLFSIRVVKVFPAIRYD